MKLSTVFAKLTSGKAQVVGGLMVAAAAVTLAAPAANAQHVAFGVQIGGPRYVAPVPAYGYGYVAPAAVYVAPAYGYGYVAPRDWDHRRDEWRDREPVVQRRDFDGRRDGNRRDGR